MQRFARHQNMEAVGEPRAAGAWKIQPLHDLVSENRYLHFSLRTKRLPQIAPSIMMFRAESAASISPDSCPETVAIESDAGRIEFITKEFSLLSDCGDNVDAANVIETVIQTILRLERYHFVIHELSADSIGIDANQQVFLLPHAYILPYLSEGGRIPRIASNRGTGGKKPLTTLTSQASSDIEYLHTALFNDFTSDLLTRGLVANEALAGRLRGIDKDVKAGVLTTCTDLYPRLFDAAPPEQRRELLPVSPSEEAIEKVVSETIDRVSVAGSVVVLHGPAFSHKSEIVNRVAQTLESVDSIAVRRMDEWELFGPGTRGPAASRGDFVVWIIDDCDEKQLPWSDLGSSLQKTTETRHSFLLSHGGGETSAELVRLLQTLANRSPDHFREIRLGADASRTERIEEYLHNLLAAVNGTSAKNDSGAAGFLAHLCDEERHLLELLCVSRFALPFDIAVSMFPETADSVKRAMLRFSELGCVELFYRRALKKSNQALFLRVKSPAFRDAVYRAIPDKRRADLHRMLALVGGQGGGFPDYFLLYHSILSGNPSLAASYAVDYMTRVARERRQSLMESVCAELVSSDLPSDLPVSDRIVAIHETAIALFEQGRNEDAEKLLNDSIEFLQEAGGDQILRVAERLASVYRLLADRWEARGEFKRALHLLEIAREELQNALPIPEQAKLLNDIGWLQYRLGEYDASMDSCRMSLNTLNANQYPLIVAQALNLMGVVHFNTSRYDEAVSYYEQGASLRQRASDDNALAASYNNLALAYQSKGEFERALDYHRKSLELKKKGNNKPGIAGGFLNLALLYLEAGNLKQARAKCLESLAISEELGNDPLVAENYVTLGDIALEDDDFRTAEEHYRRSRDISQKSHAINEEMGALRRLSSLCLRQQRFEEAREHASAARALVDRIGSKYESAHMDAISGDLEAEQGRAVEALRYYEGATGKYVSLSKYRLAATVLAKMGLIQMTKSNEIEARGYFERANELVRADIGRELPAEFVELQNALRTQATEDRMDEARSGEIMDSFYELAGLIDHAQDPGEFIRRLLEIVKDYFEPLDGYVALRHDGRFVLFDGTGQPSTTPLAPLEKLFGATLRFGGMLHSESPEMSEIGEEIRLSRTTGFVCVPLKALGDDVGCLLFHVPAARLPLTQEEKTFFTWLRRYIVGTLSLMLQLNPALLNEADGKYASSDDSGGEPTDAQYPTLIGKSEAMRSVFRTLEKVKGTDSGILILGESGTGKSALARAAHFTSPRRNRQFQEIHCAQIPHNLLESELFGHERGSFTGAVQRKLGLCEMANGGTLFLDDINVMPVETQTKLLNFIESKSFIRLGGTQRITADVRIVSASNEDLEQLCSEGKFRYDLYYRLKVILIDLPPLRDRQDDMLAIALDYLRRSCAEKGLPPKTLAPETIQLLKKAPWRGNVRELQNVLERVVVLSDDTVITPSSLPDDFLIDVAGSSHQSSRRLDELVDEIIKLGGYSDTSPLLPALEALLAKRMVDHMDGKTKAAKMLGVSKPTLYARLRDYDKMA